MRPDVAAALSKSAAAFHDTVWPAVRDGFGGGHLVSVESVTETTFAKTLDVEAGVDAWQVVTGAGMRPIASRVQAGWGRMDTFTIRWSTRYGGRTEIDKRIDAIREGYLYPAVTVQAYLDCPANDLTWPERKCECPTWSGTHRLLSAAWVDTVQLYEFASAWRQANGHHEDLWRARDGACVKDVGGGNRMLVIPWDLMPTARVTTMEEAA